MKLDLGCGPKCLPGFIGVDRFPLPGVQVIADLDKPLPFEDDSVELVHAAHSLEHVSDLMFTMRELYRVCKHKAQVCIVVPYYEQKLNLANPYHLQVFNEHTPRFWTRCSWAPIDPKEYYHPHAVTWGLSESDNSNPGLEIRLLRMEFFYFPRFNKVDPSRQRELRQNLTDVCHQIAYHLVVWKDDNDDDYIELTNNLDAYPFLDTPALQKSRADADAYQAEDSFTLAYAEDRFSGKLQAQHDHIVECERKLLRNDKLIKLLTGSPDLPAVHLKRLDDYLEANYRSRKPRQFRLSKEIPTDGYVEYQVAGAGAGAYNSISLCVYLSAESEGAQLGVEVVDKSNSIVWNSIEELSDVNTVGVVNFSLGKSLRREDVSFIRVFGRKLDVGVQVVECSITSRWPFRPSRLIPYACFKNDE
ncbi:class I SAM-dependent methyltransferase [Pseudomonas mandelii]|uniref:class I SAM-dependent methyltransferase n=1 Tax=Pseudomonas mandelii TaxID=75612 RepID=UPI0003A345A8|nr:methyltransferase domain-containing protein [Pseudomonas mandelii]